MEAIFLAGAVQALYFAILLFNKRNKHTADIILGLWLSSLSLTLIIPFLIYTENLGRHYINIGQGFPPIGNNLSWMNFAMINLNDKSGIIYPWFNLSMGDNSEFSATAYIPFGDDNSEFGGFGYGGLARIRIYF